MSNEEGSPNGSSTKKASPKHFKFPSHQSHLVSLAKMCQENKQFTDCVIQCDGVKLKAHRLVLGAASSFLKNVFQEVPSSLAEATIVVPGVHDRVVSALLDFLYTGEMTVDRGDTADLQLLIETLQIDPALISVDSVLRDNHEDEGGEAPAKKDEDSREDKKEEEEAKSEHSQEKEEEPGESEDKASPPTASSASANDNRKRRHSAHDESTVTETEEESTAKKSKS